MTVKELKITALKPYENNPRINDGAVEAVANSIKEFGFKVPIVIDADNVIIAGHTRLKAAEKLGLEKVPCIVASDLTPEQVKAFRIADNKTAELAEWDIELLESELDELRLSDYDMEQFGFEDFFAEEPAEIIEDEIPEIDEDAEPTAKLGDIWQLGRHRLMCGDSTDALNIDLLINGQKINMIYTDPPYGMDLDTDYSSMKNKLNFAKEKNFTGGKKYEQGIVDDFNPEMINQIFKLNVSEVFLWGADYFAELLPDKNNGSWIVWDKRANNNDNILEDESSDKMYGSCFELCWSKKKHKREIARVKWAGVFGKEQEFDHKRYHPTQKPIKLSSWFIEKYSDEDDKILDLFGGSGSTLIAREQLNRNCFMMELDPKYCDVIIKRWETLTGEKAKLLK